MRATLRWTRSAMGRMARPCLRTLERFRRSSCYTPLHGNYSLDVHIREAAAWLVRAQDSGSDPGVAYGTRFGSGFDPSYPETTGYIICTFLRLAKVFQDREYNDRALRMGQWEMAIQMECGAVMAGKANSPPSPAIFNTGQVLLGWAALIRSLQASALLAPAHRAADWMLAMQEEDGSWVRGNSIHTVPGGTTYNVNAALGLAEFGSVAKRQDAIGGAIRNAEFALRQQAANGWFANCCLSDPERPLLHTLAYTMEGLLGLGKLAQRHDLIAAAKRTADALLRVMAPDGFISGRLDAAMRPAASWACLTGTAQTSGVWFQLYELTGERQYLDAARLANRYLMARHDISSPDPAIRGGLAGSWPVWGDYGRLMVLNWATKYLLDALLYDLSTPPNQLSSTAPADRPACPS